MSTPDRARSAAAPTATSPAPRSLLRVALQLDAVVTAANGAAYLLVAEPLEDLLGLSPSLLRGAGALLLAYAAIVWLAAAQPDPPRRTAYAIVGANALWAIASIVVAVAGWGSPSTAGTVWIALQACVVAGFAALQLAGIRSGLASWS